MLVGGGLHLFRQERELECPLWQHAREKVATIFQKGRERGERSHVCHFCLDFGSPLCGLSPYSHGLGLYGLHLPHAHVCMPSGMPSFFLSHWLRMPCMHALMLSMYSCLIKSLVPCTPKSKPKNIQFSPLSPSSFGKIILYMT